MIHTDAGTLSSDNHRASNDSVILRDIKRVLDEIKPLIQKHSQDFHISYAKALSRTIEKVSRLEPEVPTDNDNEYTAQFHKGFKNFTTSYIQNNIAPEHHSYAETVFENHKLYLFLQRASQSCSSMGLTRRQRIDSSFDRDESINTLNKCLREHGFTEVDNDTPVTTLKVALNFLKAKVCNEKIDAAFDMKVQNSGFRAGHRFGAIVAIEFEQRVETLGQISTNSVPLEGAQLYFNKLRGLLFLQNEQVTIEQILSEAVKTVIALPAESFNLSQHPYYMGFERGFDDAKESNDIVGKNAVFMDSLKARSLRKCVNDMHVVFDGHYEHDVQLMMLGRLTVQKTMILYSGSVRESRFHILNIVSKYIEINRKFATDHFQFLFLYGRKHGKTCGDSYARRFRKGTGKAIKKVSEVRPEIHYPAQEISHQIPFSMPQQLIFNGLTQLSCDVNPVPLSVPLPTRPCHKFKKIAELLG